MEEAQAGHRESPTREVIACRVATRQFRCSGTTKEGRRCGWLLAYVARWSGYYQTKCPRCGTLNVYDPGGGAS